MEAFTISYWPNAYSTSEEERVDVVISSIDDLRDMIWPPKIEPDKKNQKIMTRIWQKSRKAGEKKSSGGYLITLDFDAVEKKPKDIADKLAKHEISHIVFTTWGHKVDSEKNKGLNRFKVILPFTVTEKQIRPITSALGHIVGKKVNKTDDLSTNIFFGGVHPNHKKDAQIFVYSKGKNKKDTLNYLKNLEILEDVSHPPERISYEDEDEENLRIYEKTIGQDYTHEEIKEALDDIDGREVGEFSRRDVWLNLCLALKSTQDEELFNIFDDWCRGLYTPTGEFIEGENRTIWDQDATGKSSDQLVSLSTFWFIRKLNIEKRKREALYIDDYGQISNFYYEPPEEVSFLIKDLIPEKSIGFISGVGGVGKSTLCLEIAKAISSGEPLLGHHDFTTIQGSVLVINKEDRRIKVKNQFINMVNQELAKLSENKKDFEDGDIVELTKSEKDNAVKKWDNVYRPPWADDPFIRLTNNDKENNEDIKFVINSLKKKQEELKELEKPPIRLIIFDPLNMWHGGDQSSQKDMSQIFSVFQKIQKEIDTAVLIVHHMNKTSEYSGSHTIRDSGRFMIYLRPAKVHPLIDSKKYLELYIDKSNDAKSGYTAFYLKRLEKGLFDFVHREEIFREVSGLAREHLIAKLIEKEEEKKIIEEFKKSRSENNDID